jgi:hypothetical protein
VRPDFNEVSRTVRKQEHERVGKEGRKIEKKMRRDRKRPQIKGY